jgi:hypothetical protein
MALLRKVCNAAAETEAHAARNCTQQNAQPQKKAALDELVHLLQVGVLLEHGLEAADEVAQRALHRPVAARHVCCAAFCFWRCC